MESEGLNSSSETAPRPLEIAAPRIDTYRFSMANLEETQDADLDAILGELCALDSEYDDEISRVSSGYTANQKREHCQLNESSNEQDYHGKDCVDASANIIRTDSPDNDSAFSDTVSMLSSESSASSSVSSKIKSLKLNLEQNEKNRADQQKADKIKLALERMREANIKKLFIKAFTADGSSKSLLVDEKMSCGYVTRLLADKNHVAMEPKWAIVEHLPDLYMERVYEDHELLVDNLMLWTRDSKNKILFVERTDKNSLFQRPEKFLLSEDDQGWSSEQDEHSRQVILEEFFGQAGLAVPLPAVPCHPAPPMEGPLYLKSDAKKGWKKYNFFLRPSGLYYAPKDKVKNTKELACLATFETNEVYTGINWKKKYKSPTDFCFAIKHPKLQQPKSVKFIKFLCADDRQTLERWVTAIRIVKHGRQLLENYRVLVDELTLEDLDNLAHARSCSISSIPTKSCAPLGSPAASSSNASQANSDISSGRHSRASSSSSSGCMSDSGTASETAFDCEFPMGTIKRKPSMKPNIPLTWMTRQLKEMAEQAAGAGAVAEAVAGDGGTLTRRPRHSATFSKHQYIDAEKNNYAVSSAESDLSCLSLPPPPPELLCEPAAPVPPPPPLHTPYSACLLELHAKKLASAQKCENDAKPNTATIKKVAFADDFINTGKKSRKGSESSEQDSLPRKPLPPKRSETTRLSSLQRKSEEENPPTDFLKDLQRVMRKKWQVAQKCKLEPSTTPHEVLGFREFPAGGGAGGAGGGACSVSQWVQEHYGAPPSYENVRRRPPPPPRRSDSTHLSLPLHPTA